MSLLIKPPTVLLSALLAVSGNALAHHQQQQQGQPQWRAPAWQHGLSWDHQHCGLYVRGKIDSHHGEAVLLQCAGSQGEGTRNSRSYNTIGFEAAHLCGRTVRLTATDGQPLPWTVPFTIRCN